MRLPSAKLTGMDFKPAGQLSGHRQLEERIPLVWLLTNTIREPQDLFNSLIASALVRLRRDGS